MKLLMISGDRSLACGKRGAFWYTLQEMRKHWDRIDVICPHASSRGGDDLVVSGDGGEVHLHPSPHGLWYQPRWIVNRGSALIEAFRHDVMTVHEYPPFYNGLGARRLAARTGIPYAMEIHHVVGFPVGASLAERIGYRLSRWAIPRLARSAAAVRTVNASVQELLVSWGVDRSKIRIVHSFYLDRALLSKDGRPPSSYDVSFCGRLVANKQLATLIEAIADIPELRLLVIGDGPERSRCQELANRLRCGERVTFLGWLPSAEAVMGAVLTARMYVMNSSSEGGPRSALEAMGMGMPVIVTPVGIMPEVIEDGVNGLFTDGSKGDLRRKIMYLLAEEGLRDRLRQEAVKVLDHFDRPTLIGRYADFLKSLVPST